MSFPTIAQHNEFLDGSCHLIQKNFTIKGRSKKPYRRVELVHFEFVPVNGSRHGSGLCHVCQPRRVSSGVTPCFKTCQSAVCLSLRVGSSAKRTRDGTINIMLRSRNARLGLARPRATAVTVGGGREWLNGCASSRQRQIPVDDWAVTLARIGWR